MWLGVGEPREMAQSVRALDTLSEECEFGSQHAHGRSQQSVSSFAADLTPSSNLQAHCMPMVHIHTSTHTHKMKIKKTIYV